MADVVSFRDLNDPQQSDRALAFALRAGVINPYEQNAVIVGQQIIGAVVALRTAIADAPRKPDAPAYENDDAALRAILDENLHIKADDTLLAQFKQWREDFSAISSVDQLVQSSQHQDAVYALVKLSHGSIPSQPEDFSSVTIWEFIAALTPDTIRADVASYIENPRQKVLFVGPFLQRTGFIGTQDTAYAVFESVMSYQALDRLMGTRLDVQAGIYAKDMETGFLLKKNIFPGKPDDMAKLLQASVAMLAIVEAGADETAKEFARACAARIAETGTIAMEAAFEKFGYGAVARDLAAKRGGLVFHESLAPDVAHAVDLLSKAAGIAVASLKNNMTLDEAKAADADMFIGNMRDAANKALEGIAQQTSAQQEQELKAFRAGAKAKTVALVNWEERGQWDEKHPQSHGKIQGIVDAGLALYDARNDFVNGTKALEQLNAALAEFKLGWASVPGASRAALHRDVIELVKQAHETGFKDREGVEATLQGMAEHVLQQYAHDRAHSVAKTA